MYTELLTSLGLETSHRQTGGMFFISMKARILLGMEISTKRSLGFATLMGELVILDK